MPKTKHLCYPWARIDELIEHLGGTSPERVYLRPFPGQATEKDVVAIRATLERRLCELVDGVLVEIAYGFYESVLSVSLGSALAKYNEKSERGVLLGANMAYRLRPGCVRRPSISFVSWDRFLDGKLPDEEIPDLAPDLAIQILRVGNTEREMQMALKDYFAAGVQRVWLIDPRAEMADVYSSPARRRRVQSDQSLNGGPVLPGFSLSLTELFRERTKPR